MNKEIKNGIIIALTIVFILLITYLTTAVFLTGEIGSNKKNNSDLENSNSKESVSSLYDNMIIASKTFDKKENEYMVVFFSEKNSSDDLKSAISSYDSSSNELKLYKVNIDEAINKYVVSDTFNGNATNSSELKIIKEALITIKDGKIGSYEITEKDIITKLK